MMYYNVSTERTYYCLMVTCFVAASAAVAAVLIEHLMDDFYSMNVNVEICCPQLDRYYIHCRIHSLYRIHRYSTSEMNYK